MKKSMLKLRRETFRMLSDLEFGAVAGGQAVALMESANPGAGCPVKLAMAPKP